MTNKKIKVEKKSWWILIGILLIGIVLVGTYWYLLKINQKKSALDNDESEIPVETKVLTEVKEILEGNKGLLKGKVIFSKEGRVWWIDNDGSNIINKESPEVRMDFECSSETTPLVNIDTEIRKIFIENGYKTNLLNSSKDLSDGQFYDYVQAYEKDTTKCTLVIDPDCSGEVGGLMTQKIHVACTNKYTENYEQQVEIIKDLKIKDAVISIKKRIGSAASININYRRTGYYVIAKMESNGHWKKVYAGQDIPLCKDLEENDIPVEIVSGCQPIKE